MSGAGFMGVKQQASHLLPVYEYLSITCAQHVLVSITISLTQWCERAEIDDDGLLMQPALENTPMSNIVAVEYSKRQKDLLSLELFAHLQGCISMST